MRLTIDQMLAASASRYAGKRTLVTPDRTLTIDQLNRLASNFSQELATRGIRRGDRVTLWLENGWRWMAAYYGALRLGAIVNPCNILLTADEVAFIVEDCDARAVVVASNRSDALRGRTSSQLLIEGGEEPNGFNFDVLSAGSTSGSFETADIDGSDTAAIVYTSGTTGRPKGACLTHSTIVLNTIMTAQMHGRGSGDVVVTALPCTHVYGNIVMNAAILYGMTLVLLPRFDEVTVLRAIETHRATMFEGVPTMYLRLLNAAEFDRTDFSSLRLCTVGGQSMPVPRMQEAEQRLGCRLLELWGMTELGGLATTHPHSGPSKLGSIGVPLPMTEVRVTELGAPGVDVPQGEAGELLIRGPLVMQGYHGDQSMTEAAIDREGWLRTGDVVRQDADGYLYLVDRVKEVIVSGGYKVYPAEVERVIAAHPSVAMVAVAAKRDEIKGMVPQAFVVLRFGQTCAEQELIEYCRPQLAAYKVPRAVQFLEDLPKTSTGKILRRALADSAA